MPPLKDPLDKTKKPRHRHSPAQLTALNDLYEQTEHPTLQQRLALAQNMGLETKSVNAWFQNKRASTKKQPRGTPYEAPQLPSVSPSYFPPYADMDDDYSLSVEPIAGQNRHFRSELADQERQRRNIYTPTEHTLAQFNSDAETMSWRIDIQPSTEQIHELQRIYTINPHPSVDETRVIANRTGMRYQNVVEWFQAQVGKVDEYHTTPTNSAPDGDLYVRSNATLGRIPGLPPGSSHPSLFAADNRRCSSAIPLVTHDHPIQRSRSPSPRNASPYGSTSASSSISLSSRQRRGRPDNFQLHGLKRLLSKTASPTIEERSALALEIGMDIGKVTNWFRNLRQSARKRERKLNGGGSDDDLDSTDRHGSVYSSSSRSVSVSRSDTARLFDRDGYERRPRFPIHSSDDDEEAQEAVTPSPSPSPAPSPSHVHYFNPDSADLAGLDQKTTARFSGIRVEDALLLLGFHRHSVTR
ncbi:homeodomain transcription factor [Mycena rebaudengoi]|nr:homeodomain transcription factor [Mycena rebaudengoi]